MNFTKNYTALIAALVGDILDNNYPEAFLSKYDLRVELTERTEDEQIVTLWLGKAKATRQFSVCSFSDIHGRWHQTVFGSLAELPLARQKQLYKVLHQVVTVRIAEEESGDEKPKRPRTPRKSAAQKEEATPPQRRGRKKAEEGKKEDEKPKIPSRRKAAAKATPEKPASPNGKQASKKEDKQSVTPN